jgi:acetoin utilization deacetylase AcuC-like enzyme
VGIIFLGEAILAAQMAYDGEPAFGLIRPPGHNASPDSCWGFCYFNNMAVSLRGLMKEGKVMTSGRAGGLKTVNRSKRIVNTWPT